MNQFRVRPGVLILLLSLVCPASQTSFAGVPPKEQQLGPGYTKEFTATTVDLLQALREVLEDETIHGTLIFDRQPVLTGAEIVESTSLFEPWKGQGKVFYKIRKDAIAPRHFLESADQGTIAVRYVVTSITPERVRLHVDAVYVENSHRHVHISDGTVESSECKAVEDHLQVIQTAEQEAYETNRRRESADLVRETQFRQREDESRLLSEAQSSVHELEQQVNSIRHEMERRIKAPGANLKAAPFQSAANVSTLRAYDEVVIVIVTPHWLGVQTPEGQRGWLRLEELEMLP